MFTDEHEYEKKLGKFCDPSTRMSSTNANDAKRECSKNPGCHMFYRSGKDRQKFLACEISARIWSSSFGAILFQLPGNETYTQL